MEEPKSGGRVEIGSEKGQVLNLSPNRINLLQPSKGKAAGEPVSVLKHQPAALKSYPWDGCDERDQASRETFVLFFSKAHPF